MSEETICELLEDCIRLQSFEVAEKVLNRFNCYQTFSKADYYRQRIYEAKAQQMLDDIRNERRVTPPV